MKHSKATAFAKVVFFAAFVVVGFFAFSPSASAATYYANSSTGDDTTGAGTIGSPYLTFHKAYTAAAASGDTINLTGTFTWTDAGETGDAATTGYTINKSLTITGQGASSTIIQAHATTDTADRNVFTIAASKTVVINSVTIRNGKATSSGGLQGGAVTVTGTLTVNSSIITANRYTYAGNGYYAAGAFFVDQTGTLTVDKSTISNNVWTSKYYGSGGIYVLQSGAVTVTNSTISGNTATSSNPTDFAYSYAEPSGAFGAFRFTTNVFTNVTITGNSTNSYSGAMQIYYTYSTTITNCTITGNTGSAGTGGILYESLADGHKLFLKNTILADNTGASSASSDFYAYDAASATSGRLTDNGYNIVETSTTKTWSGTGDITGNQASLNISGSLADNNTLYGPQTLALSSGSVAINAGSAAAANGAVAVPTSDQRGGTRNSTTDIGAYEYSGGGLVVQYTLTYSANANGSLTGTTSQTVNSGADGTAVTAVPATGYHFTSWSDASTQNPRTDTAVAGNVTVSASFAIDTFTLTYTAGANGSITGTSPQTVNYNASGSAVTAVPAVGHTFTAWSDASTANPRTDSSVTADVSVTATFTADTFTVTYSSSGTGSISGSSSQTVSYGGSSSSVTATPNAGYAFASWSDGSTANPRTDTNVVGDVSVTASYSLTSRGGRPIPARPVVTTPVPVALATPVAQVVLPSVAPKKVAVAPVAIARTPVKALAPSFAFTKTMRQGSDISDVKSLQIFLNAHGYTVATKGNGSPGNETNFFGGATARALKKFQEAHAKEILVPLQLTQPTGVFGSLTRNAVNSMLQEG